MERDSLQGRLLVSSAAHMQDPNFSQTVILLVQAGAEGALGLVLNRALEVTVEEACSQVLETPCTIEAPMYKGGPCEGPLMAVHTSAVAGDVEIIPGIYFTTERDKIEELLSSGADRVKFFVGYSGWASGQLSGEIELGSWINAPASQDRVFDADPDQWTRLLTELTAGQPIRREQMPIDPSLN